MLRPWENVEGQQSRTSLALVRSAKQDSVGAFDFVGVAFVALYVRGLSSRASKTGFNAVGHQIAKAKCSSARMTSNAMFLPF